MTQSSLFYGYIGFPSRHCSVISAAKSINIVDTKTFTTISTVAIKGVLEKINVLIKLNFNLL